VLGLLQAGEELGGGLGYATALFDAATIARLTAAFRALLAAAAASPEAAVLALPLLAAAERHQVVHEWSHGAVADDVWMSLVARFRGWARAAPERAALLSAGGAVGYGEVDRASDALARRLAREGAGRGTLVGLCAERSPEMIAGLLAILKAGAAFLPLDPSYPRERLAFMVEDSAAALVLAAPELAALLPAGARVLHLGGPPAADGDGPPPDAPEPGDPAYAIYTSGSTGVPKGVLLGHLGLGSLAREIALLLGIDAGSRVLQFAALSFDAAVWEIATALGAGATLCLAAR